jgi:translation elongation factor EF-G
MAQKMNQLQQ